MDHPLLSSFTKTHGLIAKFAAYIHESDVEYWLDILKDYRIDLNSLAEKGAYCLDFSLISPCDNDVFKATSTVSIGEYDSITLNVDQNGRLVYIYPFDDAQTGLCSLYEDEYFSYSDSNYLPKQSSQQSKSVIDTWFKKQKLTKKDLEMIILD